MPANPLPPEIQIRNPCLQQNSPIIRNGNIEEMLNERETFGAVFIESTSVVKSALEKLRGRSNSR
jgi:hypothetical protein